jgi:predicted nucleic acid-binding Zn ribbon protein
MDTLTDRHITLIRVALLQRMTAIKNIPACRQSYDDMRELLTTGPLSLAVINRRKARQQPEIEDLAKG